MNNDVARAIDYLLKRWAAFTRFLDDARICISNNAAERALRGIALGTGRGRSAARPFEITLNPAKNEFENPETRGQNSTIADSDGTELFTGEAWFDLIEADVRDRVRSFIEELMEQELTAALGRHRHERPADAPNGYRNGGCGRQLLGSFGPA